MSEADPARENELENHWRKSLISYSARLTACETPASRIEAAKVMWEWVAEVTSQEDRSRRMDCLAQAIHGGKVLNGEAAIKDAKTFEAFITG